MASNQPNIKSYEEIYGDIVSTYMSKIGVNDLSTGSAITSFFECMAQAIYRASGDNLSILRDFSVDRATGEALQRLATENGLTVLPAKVTTGKVTITDTNFTKISTKIYAGANPPNIGSTVIKVSDASSFTGTGAIYIGRGSPNIEGPISYSSITPVGSYYEITLSTPTTKFHNISESVILAQGGTRIIPAGTIVQTINAGSAPVVKFTVTQQAIILDGETEITSVSVAAQEPGSDGNVPKNAIKDFSSTPFDGATVTNPQPFTTGRNEETDSELRIRIKKTQASKGLGTALVVKQSVLGAKSLDDNSVVTSDEIFTSGSETTLFIDNGEGYEEKTTGVGLEYIVDSALGGEVYFQLSTGGSQTSVAKAFLQSTLSAPFGINPNDRLAILVGGVFYEHVFNSGDFKSDGYVTAYEVVSSINSDSELGFVAQTANSGTQVVILAKEESNEYLQTTVPTVGTNAAIALGLPSNEIETLRLYKNRRPLSRNGNVALIETESQSNWVNTIATGDTLIIAVDGTLPITYTFTDADFIAEGTYISVASTNTLSAWINVINSKVVGATASINGNKIILKSNLLTNSRASLVIDSSSTLVTKNMFSVTMGLSSYGTESDFTLSRNTAQFKLNSALAKYDSLTAGTEFTRAFVSGSKILGGSINLSNDGYLWVLLDNQNASIINHGAISNSLVDFTKQGGNVVRFRSNMPNAFVNAAVGDYVVIWSGELSSASRLEGRILSIGTQVSANDYFELKITSSEYAAISDQLSVVFSQGLAILRSEIAPQKLKVAAGSYNINAVATLLSSQLIGASASIEDDERIVITSNTRSTYGSVLIFTFNAAAVSLNFTVATQDSSILSHYAYYESQNTDRYFPSFIHSSVSTDISADVPSAFISSFGSAIDLSVMGIEPNLQIGFTQPYITGVSQIKDLQGKNEVVQVQSYVGSTVNVDTNKIIRRLRSSDRYFLLNPLDLDAVDGIVTILDNDPSNKAFSIPLYRKALSNITMPIDADSFRAYDVDSGTTALFSQFFSGFDFNNYKAFMKARNVIDPTSLINEDAILYRSALWGASGNKFNVGYIIPSVPNADIQSYVTIDSAVNVRISLKSGAAVPNTIDGTTQWDVTVTPNTPVATVDEVTYTWNSVGTAPNMIALVAGNYVTIGVLGEFSAANTGTFRIVSAGSTYFTVRRPTGIAVAEINKACLESTTISLYENNDTTAQEIADYVNASLSNYLSATIINDGGLTGAGIIDRSTYEDRDFVSGLEGITLVDGINWILATDTDALAPVPNFTFKNTLDLPSFSTNTANAYAFNNGEDIRLVPTTMSQVDELISTLAVSGFTTLGSIDVANRNQNLQLATDVLGSGGSLLIAGGSGNKVESAILGASSTIPNTDLMRIGLSRSSGAGLHTDQWVKLVGSYVQHKDTDIGLTTNVTIVPNSPAIGSSTITLGNREIYNRFFGQPKNFFRDRARAFHVENQGSLVCVTWDGLTGSDPVFSKAVEINADSGQISVAFDAENNFTSYTATSGTRNFIEVAPDDIMTISGLVYDGNNGIFKVMGVSDDGLTVTVDNSNGASATSATVNIANLTFSTGIIEGDMVTLGTSFNQINRGTFRVIRVYNNSFYIDNRYAVEERIVVSSNLRALGFDSSTQFDITVNGNSRIEWNTTGTEPTLGNAKMGDVIKLGTAFDAANQGEFLVVDSGDNYIEYVNAKGVAESAISVTSVGGNVLESNIPSLVFNSYENTLIGDTFVISGSVLEEGNRGSYTITNVLNKSSIVVSAVMVAQSSVSLSTKYTQLYVQEQYPYIGYKKIYSMAVDPANSNRYAIVFDSNNQYNKINEDDGGVVLNAIGKLNFSETVVAGLDSYRFHTGLVAEANKIVYGDPRDPVTYPGVGAAGAEIFIKPPLVRRIQVSVNLRVQTGVPFARISDQVKNNIAALINASPIGQSIAISDIIASINTIPGTKAVSITSPSYSPSNDVIVVNPSEKPFILDIAQDILVAKVG